MELNISDFNIEQIANSGQCFRINKCENNCWEILAFGKILKIKKIDTEKFIFDCSVSDYQKIWEEYFDLQRDYGKVKNDIIKTDDKFLIEAVKYGYGLRILKQDTWEMIVSYIISQRNNIPRIKNTIEKLCAPFEKNFPSPDMLKNYTEENFKNLGLGYRARYINEIVHSVLDGKLDLAKLKILNYDDAIEYLKRFNGIGQKVADCIALFGLNKIGAFPRDVWINRVIEKQYQGNFDINSFSGFAGIVQQYMFFYQRYLGK